MNFMRSQYQFQCQFDNPKKLVLLTNDRSRNYWYQDYFSKKTCDYEVKITSTPKKLQRFNKKAYFNFGTNVSSLPNNLVGKQLNQWIPDIHNIFEKYHLINLLQYYDTISDYKFKSKDFIPETYLINFDREKYTDQEKKFKELKNYEDIWYEKRIDSGKGQGNTLFQNTNTYNEEIVANQKTEKDEQKDLRVIQKAVKPYLYKGKKVEMRSYLLIASLDPFVVLYRNGHIQLTLSQYKHELTGNKQQDEFNHVSTLYVQSQNQNYDQEKYIIDHTDIQLFKEELFSYHQNISQAEDSKDLEKFDRLTKEMLTYTSLAVQKKITDKRMGQYHLFACDFSINEEFNPKLLECNAVPATKGTPILPSRTQSRGAVWESLDLILNIFENSKGNQEGWTQQFKNLEQKYDQGEFELLINEATDFNFLNDHQ